MSNNKDSHQEANARLAKAMAAANVAEARARRIIELRTMPRPAGDKPAK